MRALFDNRLTDCFKRLGPRWPEVVIVAVGVAWAVVLTRGGGL